MKRKEDQNELAENVFRPGRSGESDRHGEEKKKLLTPRIPFAKAYDNQEFLKSPEGREIRVLAEFMEPEVRLRKAKVRNTIVFFGSARTPSRETAEENLRLVNEKIKGKKLLTPELQKEKTKAELDMKNSRFYLESVLLSEKLTEWSMKIPDKKKRFLICSGGGPGIMEAANRGAHKAGGQSIGMNISLPFEQEPNRFQTDEISFEFHYFFIRKFWFFYLSKAMVVFPGGFGTFDELFELLTLIQTKKTKKYMPIVIYGKEFWNEVVNFEALAKWGVISPEDLDLMKFCDTVDEAYHFLTKELTAHYLS